MQETFKQPGLCQDPAVLLLDLLSRRSPHTSLLAIEASSFGPSVYSLFQPLSCFTPSQNPKSVTGHAAAAATTTPVSRESFPRVQDHLLWVG